MLFTAPLLHFQIMKELMINQSEKVDTLKTIQLTEFDNGKLSTNCNMAQCGKS